MTARKRTKVRDTLNGLLQFFFDENITSISPTYACINICIQELLFIFKINIHLSVFGGKVVQYVGGLLKASAFVLRLGLC
jgi:hypothetical protein